MISRDGDLWLVWEHDGHVLKINRLYDVEAVFRSWLDSAMFAGEEFVDTEEKTVTLHQSFLLDYIQYLIESAIDEES